MHFNGVWRVFAFYLPVLQGSQINCIRLVWQLFWNIC